MAKSRETYSKKENQKKKLKKRLDKQEKKEERKDSSSKGMGFENMIAYVDEYGNLSSTPPDPVRKKEEVDQDKMYIDHPELREKNQDAEKKGTVTFFNESKGYGFIKETRTQDSYFVHSNSLNEPIKENDKVTFSTERTPKGLAAVNVRKI
jgi:cold shock CspA family protein